MRPSEEKPAGIDWRGWIAVAWVAWFGLLYGKTVLESRGGMIRSALQTAKASPAPVAAEKSPGPPSSR